MKDFFEGLYSYLRNHPNLKGVFGERIYPAVAAQNVSYPIIVYNSIGVSYDKNLQKESGFARQTVQFSVVDNSFAGARINCKLLRKTLKDFHGDMAGVFIEAVHTVSDEIEINEENEYMAILEMEFMYKE